MGEAGLVFATHESAPTSASRLHVVLVRVQVVWIVSDAHIQTAGGPGQTTPLAALNDAARRRYRHQEQSHWEHDPDHPIHPENPDLSRV